MATTKILGARIATPILILAWVMVAGAGRAQVTAIHPGGYMRLVTSTGHVVAGESTDAAYNGWIPLRLTTMPTKEQITAMAEESAAASGGSGAVAPAGKTVHPPVVVVKDRDTSSIALVGAFSSHQHFPEVDITVTDYSDRPATKYKLADATIVALRASVTPDAAQEPVEQLRITYAKIEILP
jgi:type VI protein secretion system component Hcp